MMSMGMRCSPMAKNCKLRAVCAPHHTPAGTRTVPKLSVTVRVRVIHLAAMSDACLLGFMHSMLTRPMDAVCSVALINIKRALAKVAAGVYAD